MRFLAATTTLTAVLLISACAGEDAEPEADAMPATEAAAPEAPAMEPDAAMPMTMVELDGSGAGGSVTMDNTGASPMLTVFLTNAGAGVHQGHIHGGTCQDRAGAVTPLEPITADASGAGQATSTVAIPADSLFNGNHIVVYHEADGSPGASIVCAELPAGAGM